MKPKHRIVPLTQSNRKFFQQFYEKYKNFMLYIADKYADGIEDRQDLMQESLARLMKYAEMLRNLDRGQTAKYIELTVKTTYLDLEQQRCKQRLLLLDREALEALLDLKEYGQEERLPVNEAVALLKQRLTQREWLLLEGKYILGYSHKELGEILGINENSVRTMVFRAKKQAREVLQKISEEGDAFHE